MSIKDVFGITKLYETTSGGREWFSTCWANGNKRTLVAVKWENEHDDPEGQARGSGTFMIDGKGITKVTGRRPRFYVYDRAKKKSWNNLEMTCYCKRVSETSGSIHDFRLAARTNHQDESICNSYGQGYIFEFNYNGRIQFRKEIFHDIYADPEPRELRDKKWWDTSDKELPKNKWIGMKFVIRTCDDRKHVQLEGYRDITNCEDGGSWGEKALIKYKDEGNWTSNEITDDILEECKNNDRCKDKLNGRRAPIVTRPGISCYLRTDFVSEARFKNFSIREIDELP